MVAKKCMTDYLEISSDIAYCLHITQQVLAVKEIEKQRKLVELLELYKDKPTLIFVKTRARVPSLSKFLKDKGYNVTTMSGVRESYDLTQEDREIVQKNREEALDDFRKKAFSIMIATDVAARGLSKFGY